MWIHYKYFIINIKIVLINKEYIAISNSNYFIRIITNFSNIKITKFILNNYNFNQLN